MQKIGRHYFAIVCVSGLIVFTNLGGPRLWDRDETRNARCTIEMLQRGDWVVPYYNGEVRDIKPAGMYWLMMSAVAVFGPTELAFRFWSAVAGVGTALATYHIGRRLFNPTVGLWAGLILASSLMFAVIARAAKVDSLLVFFHTLALTVFVDAVFRPATNDETGPQLRFAGQYYPQDIKTVALMFALMGLAVLGKGPIGFILPTAVIGMFLLIVRLPAGDGPTASSWREPRLQWNAGPLVLTAAWFALCLLLTQVSLEIGIVLLALLAIHLLYRRLPVFRPFAPGHFIATCWSMRPLTAVLAISAVALPWHIWVAQRDVRWLEGFYLTHNLGRAAAAMEGHGGSDLLYYPLTILLGFGPWSAFLLPMLKEVAVRVRSGDRWRTGYLLLACWVGVYVGLFSLARTKLPGYVLPCYPALALIAAGYLYHLRESAASTWWPRVSMATMVVVGMGLLIGLPIAASIFLDGDMWIGLIGLLPLVAAGVCFELFRRRKPATAAKCYMAFAAVFVLMMVAGVAQRIDRHRHFDRLVQAMFQSSHNPQVVSFRCLEPSWVYYSGRNIHEYHDGGEVREFLEAGDNRYALTYDEHWEELKSELPADVQVLTDCPMLLKDKDLLLIGRQAPIAATRHTNERSRR